MSTKVCTRATSTFEIYQTVNLHTGYKRLHVSLARMSPLSGRLMYVGSSAMIVQGSSISLPSGSASYAVIDTGSTLVAGPASGIAAVYARIPNSSPGTGDWEGFYSYRKLCARFSYVSWPTNCHSMFV